MLTVRKVVVFSILLVANVLYLIFSSKSSNRRSKFKISTKKEKIKGILRSLKSLHFVLCFYIATHSMKILNLNSYLTRQYFQKSGFTVLNSFVILLFSLNLCFSIVGICNWFWSFKKNIVYMLDHSSYVMLICAKYGIRFRLVSKLEMKKQAKKTGKTPVYSSTYPVE
jgi:hypothetical protein